VNSASVVHQVALISSPRAWKTGGEAVEFCLMEQLALPYALLKLYAVTVEPTKGQLRRCL